MIYWRRDMSDMMSGREEAKSFVDQLLDMKILDFSIRMLPKNSGELAVLGLLSQKEDGMMSSGDIAEALNMKTSRMAALLNALEKKNQIKRKRAEDDKRITYVIMTDVGREICSKLMDGVLRKVEHAYEVIGKEEMGRFVQTLRKLYEITKEDETCLG